MEIRKTKFKEVYLIQSKIYTDTRGYFFESYQKKVFNKIFRKSFVQDNLSKTIKKNTFRGLHFQKNPFPQAKLLTVIQGKILDVVIDLRKKSETYLVHGMYELSEKKINQIYIPEGFAHGFLSLEKDCIISYKVSNFFFKKYDSGINVFDDKLNIKLPIKKDKIYLSPKDRNLEKYNKRKIYFK